MNPVLIVILLFDVLVSIGLLIIKIGRFGYKKEQKLFESITGLSPRTIVILPVKGIDYQMEMNIQSLQQQSYKNYSIVAVADNNSDPAVQVLKNCGIDYILSEEECQGCSGKVRAIYSALRRFRDYDIYVIADSDIRVDREWLSNLVKPLINRGYGISTTFPKFYPEAGFWSTFKMYWGLIGESMMESHVTRFAWGGSLAFRKDLLDENGLREFSSALSDDIAILRIARRKGLKVAYVKDAVVEIHSPDDFSTFLEWSNRQTALSIHGDRKIFLYGMIYYASASFMIISSLSLVLLGYYVLLILFIPVILIAYINNKNAPVRKSNFIIYNILLYFFYLYNLLSGFRKKDITWRGRTYSLRSKI